MTPFERALIPEEQIQAQIDELVREYRADREAFRARYEIGSEREIREFVRDISKDQCWRNDQYQVNIRDVVSMPGSGLPPMKHLSIKRLDKEPIRDWRDMQRIKNELVGPECEGCELYPAESRVVDLANQFHMWVFSVPGPGFPFGFPKGLKASESPANGKQRPL
jgi:hypothetical protein